MTGRTKRLVVLYLLLMICLAAMGAYNQHLYRTQWRLIDTKKERLHSLSDARHAASSIIGALAVRKWAHEHGMIPSPEGAEAYRVYSAPPPDLTQATGGLEIRTLWR